MRYTWILLPLFWAVLTDLSAQNFYFPAGKASWMETGWWQNPDLVGFHFGSRSNACQLDGDTLIAGRPYRKLSFWRVRSETTYFGQHIDTTYQNSRIGDAGAIRADSAGRVYYFAYGDAGLDSIFNWVGYYNLMPMPVQTELLYYDFGLLPGDTFAHPLSPDIRGVVDSVRLLDLGGVTRRVLWFHAPAEPGVLSDTWIEGMGSLNGFFSPFCTTGGEYSGGSLACFREDGVWGIQVSSKWLPQNSYGADNECPSYTTATKYLNSLVVQLFPVPATSWVRVGYFGAISNPVYLIDLLGKRFPVPVTRDDAGWQLDLTGLAPGIYFLNFELEGRVYSGRVCKI